jgi:hypothetical protein
MGKVVNLRRARKRKAREADEITAAANRNLHGVPKREHLTAKAKTRLEERALDALRLDPREAD